MSNHIIKVRFTRNFIVLFIFLSHFIVNFALSLTVDLTDCYRKYGMTSIFFVLLK